MQVSNEAAIKLYQSFNYVCDATLPSYYTDGEDAYHMKLQNFGLTLLHSFPSSSPKSISSMSETVAGTDANAATIVTSSFS